MVDVMPIIQAYPILEDHKRVARKKVRDMACENFIDLRIRQALNMFLTTRYCQVVEHLRWLVLSHLAVAQVTIDRVVA
jgi:glycine/serine hydroxymethyltransferase